MRGKRQLEAMRLAGKAPDLVCVSTTPIDRGLAENWQFHTPRFAQLQADGMPRRADLRCLIGLQVQIDGIDAATVEAWRDACVAAGAKRVRSVVSAPNRGPYCGEPLAMTDTDGVAVWQM